MTGLQHRVEVLGSVEDHDFAPLGLASVVAEFFHQQPILDLQPRQHRARGDVAGLHHKLANPEGHPQGEQHAAPKGPVALLVLAASFAASLAVSITAVLFACFGHQPPFRTGKGRLGNALTCAARSPWPVLAGFGSS